MRLIGTLSPRRTAIHTAAGYACALALSCFAIHAQQADAPTAVQRARKFMSGRHTAAGDQAALMEQARQQHLQMAVPATLSHPNGTLTAAWQPIGPAQVLSPTFGNLTGRVTGIAVDPADASGNTIYIGTTGGGVWKSTDAAGPAAAVTFSPLTDSLPAFNANAGAAALPSLSIGAISVHGGTLLAGTGDTNDATDSYYGEGILRSADGGLTWTLIQNSFDGVAGNHSFVGEGFAGFAWSTLSPNLVVAAVSHSAEGQLVNATNGGFSVRGLFYSTDAGVTWQMANIMDGSQLVQGPQSNFANYQGNAATSVVWNAQRQRFYAAVRFHGYYESADGITWKRLATQPGLALTLAACPTNPGAYGNPNCPVFRGELATQPLTGDTFSLTTDSSNLDRGLFRDACTLISGACSTPVAFAQQLPTAALEQGGGSTAIPQADYNLALSAIPNGTDTLLFAGTQDIYRCSLAAGCSFRNTTNAVNGCAGASKVAASQHAIAALTPTGASLPLLYFANDGGLWRSTDGVNQQATSCSADDATHFQNLNGGFGSLADVVSFAQDPTDANTLIAGLGAIGTAATSTGQSQWPQLSPGEGGYTAIDPTNPQNWYITTAAGVSIRACTKGSACTAADFTGTPSIGPAQTSSDAALIDAPFLLDPALPANLITATCRTWRGPAANPAAWTTSNAISTKSGTTASTTCTASDSFIRTLAAGGPAITAASAQNTGAQIIYAGMAGKLDGGSTVGGHIFTTRGANLANATTAWLDIATSSVTNDSASGGIFNAAGYDVSSITVDAHDATGRTVYATIMGFATAAAPTRHLYRSVDGGATWLNVSSNLPNAPANSVIVDPNDANTVYVAMDTGIYVTQQIANCATASVNCWSIFGTGLPNAPIIQLAAAQTINSGMLRAATYGRGIWQIPLLVATPPKLAVMQLAPTALTFAAQMISTLSPAQTITITNTGAAALTVTSITSSAEFPTTDTCTGNTIAINAMCTVQGRFQPAATGTRSATLTLFGNVAGGQATAALTGTGLAPAAVALNPVSITFPATIVAATSAPSNITISNTGGVAATLSTATIAGDFQITANTCTTSLSPNTGCTISIVFRPTTSGARNGTFAITADATPLSTTLTGIGTAPATDTLSPLTLTFAAQQVNTTSAAQQATLTNAGDVALTGISALITTGDFTATNTCGNSLAAHSTCASSVQYVPKSTGTSTGTLTITDALRTQTITLNGTALAPPGVSLSTAALTFPQTPLATTAPTQLVTLTNNGGLPLILGATTITGDFALSATTCTPGASIAVAATCTMQIAFTPTAAGTRTGTLSITDNAIPATQSLTLTGIGADFAFTPTGPTTQTIASGTTATYALSLASAATITGNVAFTCAGAPANAFCTVNPVAAPLGTTTTITVTVRTGTHAALTPAPFWHQTTWLACIFPLGLLTLAARRNRRLVASFCCTLLLATGCSYGRLIPTDGTVPTTPTPPGTYTLTVTATGSGITHPITLQLVIQ